MTGSAAVVLSIVLAILVIAVLFTKPVKTLVGGIFVRDRKGRMTLVLTPVPKPKRKGGRAVTLVNLSKPDPRRVPAARGVSRCLSS